ncbi:hypothetical protein [Amycolatopsis lurida]|uniref:Uncharacterized protein n=1 Tax=Amycolatopsis lurida NRRL 2430 TaxID=1460371 RepID=A0A2P2FNS6_AMYLU|nr:hypothetical protein [Amycolatopsis lurida]KFU78379.1 hypothetical protein BB31_26085 [Amycolatopsis lurida NRRL 2430]
MIVNRLKPVGLCAGLTLPALVLRFSGSEPGAVAGLVLFSLAVVAASFLLAWAAEAAQMDISGGLAIAVLPEYAVDRYFACAAGSNPEYVAYAAANMTGSNRLLLALRFPRRAAWALLGLFAAKFALRLSP